MFVGHYAVGFALKKADPKMSLGLLVFGTAALDFLLGVFLLLGVEHMRFRPVMGFLSFDLYDMPYSHSLAGAVTWSLAGFLAYRFWPVRGSGDRVRPALIFGAAIASHFVLDLLVHYRDLPLITNATARIGFGLWNNTPASVIAELGLLAVGTWLYARATVSRSPWGTYGFAGIVVFLTVYYIGCFYGFLPVRSDVLAVRLLVEQGALVVAVEWVDRQREPRTIG